MAGRIPQTFIDDLLSRTDIVEVVGSRVALKRSGREFKACCPFHNEKSPSFYVNPAKQFYHCFGCGVHGTAVSFLMEHDHLSFVEAIEDLAGRAGLEVPREGGDAGPKDRRGDDLHALLANVAQHYRNQLGTDTRAKDYLKRRGLTAETVNRFAIGFARDAWDDVLNTFGATPAGREALLAVGLLIERDAQSARGSGFYDRFRDRVMFPIRDARGRVVGFGGRVLDQGEPKYLNSPETVLFHKGRELYGLYEARQALRQVPRLMVVEGYMDVVRLSQAGIHYAVATLGTSTTPDHLNRLFRVCNEVVFCFDGDRAGRAAAWRALENALPQARDGRQLRFLFLPDGHDPDSLVGEEGKEAFEARLADALPLSEYFVQALSQGIDLDNVDGRAQLAEAAKPLVARLPDGVYRELLVDRLAQVVRMPAARLATLLGLGAREGSRGGEGGNLSPGQGGGIVNAQNGRPSRPTQAVMASAGRGNLVRQAITLLLAHPDAAQAIRDDGELDGVERPGVALLLEMVAVLREEKLSTAQLLERFRGREEHAALARLAALESSLPDTAAAMRELGDLYLRLVEELGPRHRLDLLLTKAADVGLSAEEREELRSLQAGLRPKKA
jgi:DNA primase